MSDAALDAFLTFVRELTPSNVGDSLSQMVVILLERLHTHTEKCVAVLEHLIVQGCSHLEGHFKEILFIPPTATFPALERVNATIAQVCGLTYL